jgi:hypothetical protein
LSRCHKNLDPNGVKRLLRKLTIKPFGLAAPLLPAALYWPSFSFQQHAKLVLALESFLGPIWLLTMYFFICMETEKRAFSCQRKKDFLHRTNFKAPEKLYAEERSIRPFLVMQPCLALAGAKMRCTDGKEGWWELARAMENTTGEIRPPPSDTPPIYTSPPHRPKARHHFPFRALRP